MNKPPVIPSEYECLGLTWRVEVVDDLEDMHDSFGMCKESRQRILLDSSLTGWAAYETFMHEFTHGMLTAAGYGDDSEDEQKVELIAQILTQLFKTKKGNAYE